MCVICESDPCRCGHMDIQKNARQLLQEMCEDEEEMRMLLHYDGMGG